MKKITFLFFIILFSINAKGQNVTIVESQFNNGQVMDSVWYFVANDIGYNPSIVPLVTLDTITNLSTTDILILSSANVTAISYQQIQTVVDFILSGRSVYIQAEYQTSFSGSIAFDKIMQALGVNFSWSTSEPGDLSPMNVLGSLSTTPNNVEVLEYFWYGLAGGGGPEIENFLLYNGLYFGFLYSDPNSSNGTVITVSDKDWINNGKSLDLMKNILHRLNSQINVGLIENGLGKDLIVYPNPTDGNFSIDLGNNSQAIKITITDIAGKIIQSRTYNENQLLNLNIQEPTGVYLLFVELANLQTVIRLIKE